SRTCDCAVSEPWKLDSPVRWQGCEHDQVDLVAPKALGSATFTMDKSCGLLRGASFLPLSVNLLVESRGGVQRPRLDGGFERRHPVFQLPGLQQARRRLRCRDEGPGPSQRVVQSQAVQDGDLQ